MPLDGDRHREKRVVTSKLQSFEGNRELRCNSGTVRPL